MECFKCEVSGDKVRLVDVIANEGIVKLCRDCLSGDDIPLRKEPDAIQAESQVKEQGIRSELSSASGVKPDASYGKKLEEVSLRDIVDRSYQERVHKKPSKNEDVMNNFHWIIMRARRSRKITAEQLAKEIGEPPLAVKMAEQGVLPDDNYNLVTKLESSLKINILNKEVADRLRMQKPEIGFEDTTTKTLTISDLQDMKDKKGDDSLRLGLESERGIEEKPEFESEIDIEEINLEEIDLEEEKEVEEALEEIEDLDKERKDLSKDEVDDLIFGRK